MADLFSQALGQSEDALDVRPATAVKGGRRASASHAILSTSNRLTGDVVAGPAAPAASRTSVVALAPGRTGVAAPLVAAGSLMALPTGQRRAPKLAPLPSVLHHLGQGMQPVVARSPRVLGGAS